MLGPMRCLKVDERRHELRLSNGMAAAEQQLSRTHNLSHGCLFSARLACSRRLSEEQLASDQASHSKGVRFCDLSWIAGAGTSVACVLPLVGWQRSGCSIVT